MSDAKTTEEKIKAIIAKDGSSFEKAVKIADTGQVAGIAAEYKWVNENYPGSTVVCQGLNFNSEKKPFDVLNIKTVDGIEKQIFFDISNFFGKW